MAAAPADTAAAAAAVPPTVPAPPPRVTSAAHELTFFCPPPALVPRALLNDTCFFTRPTDPPPLAVAPAVVGWVTAPLGLVTVDESSLPPTTSGLALAPELVLESAVDAQLASLLRGLHAAVPPQ